MTITNVSAIAAHDIVFVLAIDSALDIALDLALDLALVIALVTGQV